MNTTAQILRRLDPHVRALLRELEAVWNEATGTASSTNRSSEDANEWVELDEWTNQTDTWPKPGGGKDVAVFEQFRVFQRGDGLRIGLGYRRRDDQATEIGVFLLGLNQKKRLVVYFQPTDDFEASRKMFAPIRGKNGGRSYFRGAEEVPPDYRDNEIVALWDVAPKHRLREIKVVLADADDWQTMVEHAAAQVRIRRLNA